MKYTGNALNEISFPLGGIGTGCIGLAGVAATYPIYNCIVRQDREKIAPEILRLTEELAFGE